MKKEQKNSVENVIDFLYQETEIHFLVNPTDKNVMVNATEMAKLFGKRTKDFLANQSTKDTILALERTLIGVRSDVKIVDNRGHMGIYFHRYLAIDFATWLDVDFKIWIISTIDEIIFAPNKKIANVVHEKQLLDKEENELKAKIVIEDNRDAIRLLEIAKRKDALRREGGRANQELANQYKMEI